jgi:hypothetical protein
MPHRKLIVAAVTALAALASAGTAAAIPPDPTAIVAAGSQPPTFNDSPACVGSHVYVDFVDSDGKDAEMDVLLLVTNLVGSHQRTTRIQMHDTGPTYHGVYFWTDLSKYAINPGTILRYAFQATDEDGLKSAWHVAGPGC